MGTLNQRGTLASGISGAARRPMVTVERARVIHAAPDAVFEAIANLDNLSQLLPRVKRIELLEQGADRARIATHMAFGPLGSVRAEGEVRWQAGREITFTTRQPVTVETRWSLAPVADGTDLRVILSLDLSPMLGPLAAFVPQENVAAMVAPDLDATLAAVAKLVEGRERTVGA